jgi:hypothetical protein
MQSSAADTLAALFHTVAIMPFMSTRVGNSRKQTMKIGKAAQQFRQ